jgi:hypothetical protein
MDQRRSMDDGAGAVDFGGQEQDDDRVRGWITWPDRRACGADGEE